MSLKNLMEDKKLNLGRPLLSVRRYSPAASPSVKDSPRGPNNSNSQPPLYKSDLKSGPVANPGAVPFLWEQTPGQPKEELAKPQTENSIRPPVAPKLPPGWYSKPDLSDSFKSDENVKNCESSKESSVSGETNSEVYVDALDTLSRSESYFLNCSMSGMSIMDDSDAKPSGNFSTDLKMREFMMDRFLPAAKAMTSEAPEYGPKKLPVVREEPQVKKMVNQEKPSLRYGPSFANRYSHSANSVEDNEEEGSDDEFDRHENFRAICGLLPKFCLKSSLGLVNPVTSMSARTRVSKSVANKVQPRSSSSGSHSGSEKEVTLRQVAEVKEIKSSLRNDNAESQSEQNKHAFGKGFKTFQEFLHDRESMKSLDVFEKTVYVDTVQKVKSPLREIKRNLSSIEEEDMILNKTTDKVHPVDSSHEDLLKFEVVDRESKILPNAQKFCDFEIVPAIDKSNEVLIKEIQKGVHENLKAGEKGVKSLEREIPRARKREESHKKLSEFLIPPPLPKSPSDSWLCRTLPSISMKNSSLHPHLGAPTNPQNRFSKNSTRDFKWEAIVKSTNQERQHIHCPEEPLAPIPET